MCTQARTHRQTHTRTHRHTHRHTHKQTQTDTHTDKLTDTHDDVQRALCVQEHLSRLSDLTFVGEIRGYLLCIGDL